MSRDMQSVLERVVDALVANYQPERIVLFGSYAYGEPKATSDIDLLILKATDKSFSKRWAEVSELVAEIVGTTPFSPIVITPDELQERCDKGDQFFEEILTEGKLLYAS